MLHTHRHAAKFRFIRGAYKSLYIPSVLVKKIALTGTPLMLNEVLWSLAMTFINRAYSTRGLEAVAAMNITTTAWNLFCVIMFAMGTAVSIVVGRELGRGDKARAIDLDRKILAFTVVSIYCRRAGHIDFAPDSRNVQYGARGKSARRPAAYRRGRVPADAFAGALHLFYDSFGRQNADYVFV